jgi:hypothetical protein
MPIGIAASALILASCSTRPRPNLFHVPYPHLFDDSTWVAARAVSFVRFMGVSDGYPNQLNAAYVVGEYAKSADRIRVRLDPRPMGLGGRVTLEMMRTGAIRVLSREQ